MNLVLGIIAGVVHGIYTYMQTRDVGLAIGVGIITAVGVAVGGFFAGIGNVLLKEGCISGAILAGVLCSLVFNWLTINGVTLGIVGIATYINLYLFLYFVNSLLRDVRWCADATQ